MFYVWTFKWSLSFPKRFKGSLKHLISCVSERFQSWDKSVWLRWLDRWDKSPGRHLQPPLVCSQCSLVLWHDSGWTAHTKRTRRDRQKLDEKYSLNRQEWIYNIRYIHYVTPGRALGWWWHVFQSKEAVWISVAFWSRWIWVRIMRILQVLQCEGRAGSRGKTKQKFYVTCTIKQSTRIKNKIK